MFVATFLFVYLWHQLLSWSLISINQPHFCKPQADI
ncbi:GSCOCG00000522001-RA-CDS [Cotesia congregata]|nr:GSCOCG00000522001-RA-CDS [Cotesia congregata]